MPLSQMKEEHIAMHSSDCGCSACREYWEDARDTSNEYYGKSPARILPFPFLNKELTE